MAELADKRDRADTRFDRHHPNSLMGTKSPVLCPVYE